MQNERSRAPGGGSHGPDHHAGRIERFYVAVDRQLKSGFETYEAAEKAAQEIKKRYPGPQVTVFDAKEHRHTTIEQPIASTKRSG